MSCVPCEAKSIIVMKATQIEKEPPVRQDLAALLAPGTGASLLPDFRFFHAETNKENQKNRWQTAEEKKRPPANSPIKKK